MRWVDSEQVQWKRFSSHRPGEARNKRLLAGAPGAPDNFELSIVDIGDYSTPAHHHNFEQFRFMLDGSFSFGPSEMTPGTLGYFPEATPYTQRGIGRSLTLLLQFGGPSGSGFMSYDDMERGQGQMLSLGEFRGGQFHDAGDDGAARARDAYEAIWEHVHQRAIVYPKPRYAAPTIMHPEAFAYESAEEPGVAFKETGRFGANGAACGFLRLAAGAAHALTPRRLYFVLAGVIASDGVEWPARSACDAEDGGVMKALEPSELLWLDRPVFVDPTPA